MSVRLRPDSVAHTVFVRLPWDGLLELGTETRAEHEVQVGGRDQRVSARHDLALHPRGLHRGQVSVPRDLSAKIPEIMAGSDDPSLGCARVSSGSVESQRGLRERQESVYGDAKRREVQLLLAAGVPQERIAERTGVSVRTIRRIGRELPGSAPPAKDALAVGLPKRSGPGRPSVIEPFRDAVATMLAEEPRLKSLEVLRRLRERGYAGGKSMVYALVRTLRVRTVRPIRRFEGLAGECSQHDFGEVLVEWTGGGRTRVHFFASRLK